METAAALSNIQSLKPNAVRRSASGEVAGAGTVVPVVNPDSPKEAQTARPVLPLQASEESAFPEKQDEGRKQEVVSAVRNFNEFFQMVRRTLQFSVDDDSGRTIVQVKDAETHEVIRQIPSEEILRLAKHLDEFKDGFKGMLLKEKV